MPNLSCLARPRPLAIPPFQGWPAEVCELPDQSLIVADWRGGPAWRVWPDGSQPPQQLPPATANATAVLPVADGYLVVSHWENRVERTGSIAWKRTDLKYPCAAVVVGDTALVTEQCGGAGQVVRLALGSGATVGTVGKGILKIPRGIAVGPTTGEIVVADSLTELVHVSWQVCVWLHFFCQPRAFGREENAVSSFLSSSLIAPSPSLPLFSHSGQVFDGRSFAQLRTLGAGMLKVPLGVCVDGGERVYVCDTDSDVKAVVVLDGASGARLATIAIPGEPRGVTVTRSGAIVVTHNSPNGMVAIDSA